MNCTKFSTSAAIVAFSVLCSTASAAEPVQSAIRIRPIKTTASAALSNDLPGELSLPKHTNATIQYLVEGTSIVGIDDDLKIDSIKLADGSEVARFRDGEKAWRFFGSTKISPDGRYAVFEVDILRTLFGKLDGATIAGTIPIHQGSDLTEQLIELDLRHDKPVVVGPFQLQIKPQGESQPGLLPLGGVNENMVTLNVTAGPTKSIISCKGFEEDQELRRGMLAFGGDQSEFSFAKPSGAKLTVKLTYWKTFEKVLVPLGN